MKLFSFICTLFFVLTTFAQGQLPEQTVQNPTISRGQYVTGGVIGSVLGFGIGHAIQERYSPMGWIFTAAEVGGIVLISNSNCNGYRDTNSQDRAIRERRDCEYETRAITGAALLIGFHAWEIVDLWKNGNPAASTSDVMILPIKDGAALSFTARF